MSTTFILGVPSKGRRGGTCKLASTVQITSFKLYTENGMKWNEIDIFTNYARNRTTKMGSQKSTTVASSTHLLQSKTTTCNHISYHIISYHISLSHRQIRVAAGQGQSQRAPTWASCGFGMQLNAAMVLVLPGVPEP